MYHVGYFSWYVKHKNADWLGGLILPNAKKSSNLIFESKIQRHPISHIAIFRNEIIQFLFCISNYNFFW